jgi:exodeoxyribonuclease VII small subunit
MQENSLSLDFEASLAELEKVVNELDGEIKLEKALALFERGMRLSTDCQRFLQAAEQRVEVLRRSATGELAVEPLEPEEGVE